MASVNYKVFTVNNQKILVSYNTLIAVYDNVSGELTTTPKKYSQTTSKHYNQFIRECMPLKTTVVDNLDSVSVTFTNER